MLYWYLRSKLFEYFEEKRVRKQFYPHFAPIDAQFRKSENPFKVSKAFLLSRGAKNPHLYGETPLTTLHKIVEEFGIGKSDTVIELGAGRGRGAFFLAEMVGCKVIAVEQIPAFVEAMSQIDHPRVRVEQGNFFEMDLSEATVLYLYGSHLTDQEVDLLCNAFKKLPSSVKIITVSYPLPGFETVAQIAGRFPWGKADIFWNRT